MLLQVLLLTYFAFARFSNAYHYGWYNDLAKYTCSVPQQNILADGFLDAAILSNAASAGLAAGPDGDPLFRQLFGDFNAVQWNTLRSVVGAGQTLATRPAASPVDFLVTCHADSSGDCSGFMILMSTDDMNNYDMEMCPSLFNLRNAGYFPSVLHNQVGGGPNNANCMMRPLMLGLEYLGRPLYHESLHQKYVLDTVGRDKYKSKDNGYGIGGETERIYNVPSEDLITTLPSPAQAIDNPDTYSFYALLAWRRNFCSWHTPNLAPPAGYPAFIARAHLCDPGNRATCPDQCPPGETYPTFDLIPTTTGNERLDVLYCRLRDQTAAGACPAGWDKRAFQIFNGTGPLQAAQGCFKHAAVGLEVNGTEADFDGDGGHVMQVELGLGDL